MVSFGLHRFFYTTSRYSTMSRLREGRANTARGAAHFLRETVGRVRYGGARGQLTVRADSGFYTHAIVAVCHEMDVRFSITIRQHQGLRNLIEAIPEVDWTPIPYWMDGAADVAETSYTPFHSEPDAAPVRLIVRRVQPTPGSQLAFFATYSYHGFITDRDGDTLALDRPSPPRRDRERHPRPQVRRGTEPSPLGALRRQRSLAGRPSDGAQPGTLDSAHRSGRAAGDHQDPPTTLPLYRRTAHPLGAPPHPASAKALALGNPVQRRPGTTARHPTPGLTAPSSPDPLTGQPIVPANSRQVSPRRAPLACPLRIPPAMATAGRPHRAFAATSRRPHPHLLESGLARSPSPTHQPLCQRQRQSLRWIRG